MDWSTWWIGSRTQWNVTKDFYMGVDVLYTKLQTADINSRITGLYVFCSGRDSRYPTWTT